MRRSGTPRPVAGRRVRRALAVTAARVAGALSGLAGHDGTALPGVVAQRVDPQILPVLGEQFSPIVAVLGGNGKTTTTRLTATVVERATGFRPASNRSGANLVQGIVTALLSARREPDRTPAVLEVDELAFSQVVTDLRPDVVILLNLIRDQLDRYGEIDAIADRWVRDLARLPAETRLVICADDPRLESIARRVDRPVLRFGLAAAAGGPGRSEGFDRELPPGGPDPAPCPACGERLAGKSSAGRGAWRCEACGLERSPLDLAVRIAEIDPSGWLVLGFDGPAMGLVGEAEAGARARVRLTGSGGAHDGAAAVLAAIALGIAPRIAVRALDGATPAFGRLEEMAVGDRRIVLTLAKNPASVAQAARAVEIRHPDGLLIGLADRPADGRDVSWIWDAALDRLPWLAPTTLTGERADDLALRFKYATGGGSGGDDGVIVDREIEHALDASLARVRPGGTLMVLGTYTALLGIRKVLQRRGLATAMPR
jgi:lipid II isoglutaminyl synthase (glutamine-hydrolysing)